MSEGIDWQNHFEQMMLFEVCIHSCKRVQTCDTLPLMDTKQLVGAVLCLIFSVRPTQVCYVEAESQLCFEVRPHCTCLT